MIQWSPRPYLNQYKDSDELSWLFAGLKLHHHESLELPLCLRADDCLFPPKNVLADVLHLYSSLVWRAIAHSLTQNHTRTQDNIISPPISQMKFGFFYEVHKNFARNSGPTARIFWLLVRHKCEQLHTHRTRRPEIKMLWIAQAVRYYTKNVNNTSKRWYIFLASFALRTGRVAYVLKLNKWTRVWQKIRVYAPKILIRQMFCSTGY